MSSDDQAVEEHFLNTHTRDTNGRFIVRLPFRGLPIDSENCKQIALKRLMNLERRFQSDSFLKL